MMSKSRLPTVAASEDIKFKGFHSLLNLSLLIKNFLKDRNRYSAELDFKNYSPNIIICFFASIIFFDIS